MEKNTINWRKATQSPGKEPVLMVFLHEGEGQVHDLVSAGRIKFYDEGVIPADVQWEVDGAGRQKLAIAWIPISEIEESIPKNFITEAKRQAIWYEDPKTK